MRDTNHRESKKQYTYFLKEPVARAVNIERPKYNEIQQTLGLMIRSHLGQRIESFEFRLTSGVIQMILHRGITFFGNDSLFRLRPDSLFQAQTKEHFGVGLAVLSFDLGVWSRCAIQVGGWAGQTTLVQLRSFFLFRIPSCAAKLLICALARLFRTMQCSQLCTPYVHNFIKV